MEAWDRDSLERYLQLYDVRWIVTATGRSGSAMTDLLARPPDWSQRPYAMWRLRPQEATGTTGSAPTVRARLNRLEVSGDPTSPGYFINYHWVPGLSVSAPARIRAAHRYSDPVPFIYVEPNGEGVVTISY
jgi:hypothetical protein